jgi:hypothetical protein
VTDEQFKIESTEQMKRLGVFDAFRFMEAPARKEYRRFFEQRTRDIAKITAVIDEAVALEQMPTVAVISQIWHRLFVSLSTESEVNDQERQERSEYMRAWYEQERREAVKRREEFIARRAAPPITEKDLLEILQIQNSRRVVS